jgi:hypothetical protein
MTAPIKIENEIKRISIYDEYGNFVKDPESYND